MMARANAILTVLMIRFYALGSNLMIVDNHHILFAKEENFSFLSLTVLYLSLSLSHSAMINPILCFFPILCFVPYLKL